MVEHETFVERGVTETLTAASPSGAFFDSSLSAFGAGLQRMFLPGGQILFRENEIADSLYIVLSGCLGVVVRGSNGHDVLVARVAAGETVGEMGLLGGGVRSATVEALRDTELLKFDKASYEDLLLRDPRSIHALISLLARRLRETTRPNNGTTLPIRTVAVVPLGLDVDHRRVASDLHKQLSSDGQRALLLDCMSAEQSTSWFHAAEAGNDIILYCAEPADQQWTNLCLRQADRVLFVASATSVFAIPPWLASQTQMLRRSADLVLLHDSRPSGVQPVVHWRTHLPVDLICHVRLGNPDDIARLARLLRGNATTLILSAGGARGFAHLGVIRALREAHVPIDLIGGCSMGSIVGATVGLEWDDTEIKERLRHSFVNTNPVNDYTLPFLSLIKGRKVARLLEQNFGGLRIEELWRPFFCVSTNLTTGTLAVHRDGPLVDALRASISIPGLLPPVMIGKDAHVDGGVMNWLPVDVSGARRGTIIAVDVASDPALVSFEDCSRFQTWRFLHRRRKLPPIVAVLLRAATVSGDSLTKMAHSQADILFKPPLENIDLLDWQACDRAIDAGYRHAVEKLEHLGKQVAGVFATPH
ncbi:MAG TPA: patatin-like phospholipase family protein [Xanthobacteraceae bacterium]|jgi:NTE family protein|nr:patatin-like phospholipase family protein [Xanthobacteraceae bacterium]